MIVLDEYTMRTLDTSISARSIQRVSSRSGFKYLSFTALSFNNSINSTEEND